MALDRTPERSNSLVWLSITVVVLIFALVNIAGRINNVMYRGSETQWVSEEITSLRQAVSDLTVQVATLTERLEPESESVVAAPTLDTERETRAPGTRPRDFYVGDTNEHCRGPREVRWRIEADEGWHIDVNSVSARATVQSSRSVFHGVSAVSEDGFTVSGRLVNNGDCVRAFGATVARDGRGTLRVAGEYTEIEILGSE